ncbi:MAG: cobalamin biosynthesis protein [Xanthomonadaceae bacterium]|nr:cobalamin biosynthesis protein [Xanthomonadaceae bacterium]MDE1884674.1 cobalamin biosynthesis protein [Xanthomonadaceae bacterium]MDE1960226.1 cobalamin biosynthesis protein [Xanthomonadaceae bacterium]MDE2083797.1 cobalamin biosynthesis protein [Xanthomonadaceae bacterium]
MAIKLVAILIVLFVAHVLPDLARLRDYSWWRAWLRWLGPPVPGVALAVGIGLPVLVCVLLQAVLHAPWFGLAGFVFAVVVLYYAWGPRDLERDVEAIDKAPDSAARLAAAQVLRGEGAASELPFAAESLVAATFEAALARWFGVLFWFVLIGPCGALLYRLSQLLAAMPAPDDSALARKFAALLDWLPAHLMALALALASNFDAVFSTWRDYHRAHPHGYTNLDLGFLDAIGRASVAADVAADGSADAQSPLVALDDAMVLVRRVLVIWLTLIALVVLGGFF